MTRPDLEALARKWIRSPATALTTEICATEQDVLDLVTRVAAAERARIVAKLHRVADDLSIDGRKTERDLLRRIADELEAE